MEGKERYGRAKDPRSGGGNAPLVHCCLVFEKSVRIPDSIAFCVRSAKRSLMPLFLHSINFAPVNQHTNTAQLHPRPHPRLLPRVHLLPQPRSGTHGPCSRARSRHLLKQGAEWWKQTWRCEHLWSRWWELWCYAGTRRWVSAACGVWWC